MPTGATAAPVLSFRRIPEFVATLASSRRLQRDLDIAFAGAGFDGTTGRACLVVHDARGRVLYARQPDLSLLPASTVKLLTAAAALQRLGADARFTTEVRAAQPPTNGIVHGDLWFVGGGDPLLATEDFALQAGGQSGPLPASRLEDLADRVVASGVREVQGRVLGDESRYDTVRYVPTWSPAYVDDGESGPLSALTVNHGFARLRPTPVPAAAPATAAAAVLTLLLERRGVRVGGVGEGVAPSETVALATLESLPVRDVVAEMVQQSDNTTAELLTKELGFRFGGTGSTDAGLDVIRASTSSSLGQIGAAGFVLADGSGLDRGNRATCNAVVALLDRDDAARALAPVLPVAAQSGTLRGRFAGTPVAGRLAAKTGSLEGVVALSGYARDEQDEVLVFSALVSDPQESAARALVDEVARLLVEHPDGPRPEELDA